MSDSIEPHGVPTADELLEAVEECLRTELLPDLDGRQQYLVRVCSAAVAQVRRELQLHDVQAAADRARLADLGVRDDAELVAEIRAGVSGERRRAIVVALTQRVRDQLAVVDPRSVS